ncbi:homoserine kinase [Phytomonospora endophytica]|uniref:Homoserine kinase n=1 Tax=Phytomonospora endophytica TaxID=714109 RepID=A0A841FR07_9ACTN|nr:homoserine kinase [Phytomonospora endophytica]MBB6038264.1 homoserine kinase [Phytomonospora endophytica]GIG67276.1 homoserine kinase [Phytomonospora endophytica]
MTRLATGAVTVKVPATSANLGPGFDSLGLALGLYDEVTAEIAEDGVRVEVTGEGEGVLPGDETHLVARAAFRAFDHIGVRPAGLRLSCRNAIPQARGLGSSSAAIVAGISLAAALCPDAGFGVEDRLRLAGEIEGHPDNVAPCLLGGFTIAWTDERGARAVRLEAHPDLKPVVYVPDGHGLTAHARAALPGRVPHVDAAFNAGRAALLVHAVTSAPELLLDATDDRIHQRYRAATMTRSADLVAELRDKGVPAAISGAGPSVIAFGGTPIEADGFRVSPLPVADGASAR